MLRTKILLASLMTAFGAMHVHAQAIPALKPITVCDVFASRMAFNGKYVAVIARMGGTFEGSWLSDARCSNEIKLDGHKWPTTIWQEYDASGQTLFTGAMVIDWEDANAKFAELKDTNKLRYESESWVIIYGRIETRKKLKRGSNTGEGGNGYGHLGAAPVQIVYRPKDIKYFVTKESRWLP